MFIYHVHLGLFYGGLCIAMAALASLMGGLLQVGNGFSSLCYAI